VRVVKIRKTQTVLQLSLQITDSIGLRYSFFKLLTIEVYCHCNVENNFFSGGQNSRSAGLSSAGAGELTEQGGVYTTASTASSCRRLHDIVYPLVTPAPQD
jgi:hypothetical protein